MQAFVGRGGHGRETRVAEVEGFGTEAADTVDEQPQASRPAEFAQGTQLVEPPGRRLMMHDRDMSTAPRFGLLRESTHVQCLHPVADDSLAGNSVLRANLRHPLAVHAVFRAQHSPLFRDHGGNHAFHCTRA